MTTQAIAKRIENNQGLSVRIPQTNGKMSLAEIREWAEVYHASGTFTDLKSVAQAIVKIKAGEDLGFPPHVSLAGIHFFQGKAVIGANLLASLIKGSGKYEYKIIEHTSQICSLQMYQRMDGRWQKMGVPVTYTIKEAADAKLAQKDNWKNFPADMLFAAVIRQATRRYCADVLRGTPVSEHYSQDEADIDGTTDFQDAPEFTHAANTVDAEPIAGEPAVNSGPADSASGDLGEPVSDAEVKASENTADGSRIDLEIAVSDLLSEKTGGDEEELKKILKGREIDQMKHDALLKLYGELAES